MIEHNPHSAGASTAGPTAAADVEAHPATGYQPPTVISLGSLADLTQGPDTQTMSDGTFSGSIV